MTLKVIEFKYLIDPLDIYRLYRCVNNHDAFCVIIWLTRILKRWRTAKPPSFFVKMSLIQMSSFVPAYKDIFPEIMITLLGY